MPEIDFDELIDNYLERRLSTKKIGRYWPSDSGGCLRKTWFSFKIPKLVEKETMRVFEAGNRLHEFIADVIDSDKNNHVELIDKEIPIKIQQNNFVISGRIDDLVLVMLNRKKYLVEVKSAKFLPNEPRENHKMQLQLYMHATGVYKGILLYIKKDNLETAQFDVFYDADVVDKIIGRFSELHAHLIKDKIPIAEAKIDSEKEWLCNYCSWKEECDKEEDFVD